MLKVSSRKKIGIVIFCFILISIYVYSTTWFRLRLARYYINKADYQSAVAVYQNILRKETFSCPRCPVTIINRTVKPELLAAYNNLKFKEPYLLQAQNYLSKGLFDEALSICEKVIKINKDYESDVVKYQLGHYKDENWQRIISVARFELSLIYMQKKRWHEASTELKKIAEPESNFRNVVYNLNFEDRINYEKSGVVFFVAGFPRNALRQFQIASALGIQNAELYYSSAKSFKQLGDDKNAKYAFKKAIQLEKDALKLNPNDLASLKRLNELYLTTGDLNRFKTTKYHLEVLNNNKIIIAQVLKINGKDFGLGENLISNGNFEIYDTEPPDWTWIMWPGNISNKSNQSYEKRIFSGMLDIFERFDGNNSLKIIGTNEKNKFTNKTTTRAGFYAKKIMLKPNTPYVISFYYKTKGLKDGQAAFWISGDKDIISPHDYLLPNTDGFWRKFLIIGWNKKEKLVEVEPLIKSYGTGEVWFDDVALEEIVISSGVKLTNNTTQYVLK